MNAKNAAGTIIHTSEMPAQRSCSPVALPTTTRTDSARITTQPMISGMVTCHRTSRRWRAWVSGLRGCSGGGRGDRGRGVWFIRIYFSTIRGQNPKREAKRVLSRRYGVNGDASPLLRIDLGFQFGNVGQGAIHVCIIQPIAYHPHIRYIEAQIIDWYAQSLVLFAHKGAGF